MPVSVDTAAWLAKRAHLVELIHAPGWDTYGADLEAEEARAIQSLVTCSSAEHDYWKGYITALRWAYHRPQKVIEAAERAVKETSVHDKG